MPVTTFLFRRILDDYGNKYDDINVSPPCATEYTGAKGHYRWGLMATTSPSHLPAKVMRMKEKHGGGLCTTGLAGIWRCWKLRKLLAGRNRQIKGNIHGHRAFSLRMRRLADIQDKSVHRPVWPARPQQMTQMSSSQGDGGVEGRGHL